MSLPKTADWEAYGVEQMKIEVCDFTGAPSVEQIDAAMNFIEQSPGKIYVHRKAGRCRSALVVAAVLIKHCGMEEQQAFDFIKGFRKHIVFHNVQWRRLAEWKQFCKNNN